MARKFLTNIDLNQNELQNAVVQNLGSDPGSPVEGQIWVNTTSHTLKFRNNSANIVLGRLDQITAPSAAVDFNGQQITTVLFERLSSDPGSPADGRFWINTTSHVLKYRENSVTYVLGRLDQINAPTASVDLNSQKITGLANGTAATDAVNLGQLQAASRGMDWKDSVRVATTTSGTLASSFENGDTIDGITLVTGDRILIKDQGTASQNGIYVVAASGSPTRAVDADADAEVTAGLTVWVEEGTTNHDTSWTLTSDNPITVGSSDLVFAKSGSAPVSSGTVTKYSTSIGNGSSTSYTVTHSLGTLDVIVQVFTNSDGTQVEPDVTHATTNTVTIAFSVAPTSNQYRVVVVG